MKRKIVYSVLLLFTVLFWNGTVFAEEISVITANAWPGLSDKGFFSCKEYEPEDVRGFRREVLLTGLAELDADVVVLNGINPVSDFADAAAESLEMNYSAWVSRSGFRVGPVSIPVNLKEGDAVFTSEALRAEEAGRLSLNSLLSTGFVTAGAKNAVQVIGRKIFIPGITDAEGNELGVYIFSASWSESVFNDRKTMERLMDAYLAGDISSDLYPVLIDEAVSGAEIRRLEAEKTLSFINSVAGASPVILAGSLNALPESDELKILKDAGFVDVFERSGRGNGYTIDIERNSNFKKFSEDSTTAYEFTSSRYRADYIFVRGEGLKPVSAEIVLDDPVYGVYPSNRFGIKAVIDVGKSRD